MFLRSHAGDTVIGILSEYVFSTYILRDFTEDFYRGNPACRACKVPVLSERVGFKGTSDRCYLHRSGVSSLAHWRCGNRYFIRVCICVGGELCIRGLFCRCFLFYDSYSIRALFLKRGFRSVFSFQKRCFFARTRRCGNRVFYQSMYFQCIFYKTFPSIYAIGASCFSVFYSIRADCFCNQGPWSLKGEPAFRHRSEI